MVVDFTGRPVPLPEPRRSRHGRRGSRVPRFRRQPRVRLAPSSWYGACPRASRCPGQDSWWRVVLRRRVGGAGVPPASRSLRLRPRSRGSPARAASLVAVRRLRETRHCEERSDEAIAARAQWARGGIPRAKVCRGGLLRPCGVPYSHEGRSNPGWPVFRGGKLVSADFCRHYWVRGPWRSGVRVRVRGAGGWRRDRERGPGARRPRPCSPFPGSCRLQPAARHPGSGAQRRAAGGGTGIEACMALSGASGRGACWLMRRNRRPASVGQGQARCARGLRPPLTAGRRPPPEQP